MTVKGQMLSEVQGLCQGTAFIRQADDDRRPTGGQGTERQRPHVTDDDLALHAAERKELVRIGQSPLGMMETMPAVAGVFVVPVIEKKIVQQRAADKPFVTDLEMQSAAQPIAQMSDCNGMRQAGSAAVLNVLRHLIELRKPQQAVGQLVKIMFFFSR